MSFKTFESHKKIRRLLGWSIIVMFVLGIFAETTRTSLIDWNDSHTTWNSIVQSRLAYSLMVVAFVAIILLDSVLAGGIFTIFKFRESVVVYLMVTLRFIYVAIKGVSIIGLLLAAGIYFNGHYGEDSASQALAYLRFHDSGFGIGLIVFGFHLLFLAYIARQTQFPKWIWWLLGLAGLGYIANSFSSLLIQKELFQTVIVIIFILPMTFSELAFFLWLWLKPGAKFKEDGHGF